MPSAGVAIALLVDQEINERIKDAFDAKTAQDARKLLALAQKGGGKNVGMPTIIILAIAFIAAIFFFQNIFAASLLVVVAGLLWLSSKIRNKAREKVDALIASNPGYWNPIAAKLKKIVLEAGSSDIHPLAWKQMTRIVE